MRRACLLLAFALSGCGGGGGDSSLPQTAPNSKVGDLRVIGNSITLHPPSPELGWGGNWGMAASSRDMDFAHLTAAALGVPVTPVNMAPLEREAAANISLIPETTAGIGPTTLVVIELGDNVDNTNIASFEPAYSQLLDAAAKGLRLLCLSTWWGKTGVDVVIEKQCEAHGGRYVYIGDIYPMPGNPDRLEKQWAASPGIDMHPHDWGMSKIAERVIAASK